MVDKGNLAKTTTRREFDSRARPHGDHVNYRRNESTKPPASDIARQQDAARKALDDDLVARMGGAPAPVQMGECGARTGAPCDRKAHAKRPLAPCQKPVTPRVTPPVRVMPARVAPVPRAHRARTEPVPVGERCVWRGVVPEGMPADDCPLPQGAVVRGGARATHPALIPFCADHRHVMRSSPSARTRYGVPETVAYSSHKTRAGVAIPTIETRVAKLLVDLVATAGGWDRVREIAGAR